MSGPTRTLYNRVKKMLASTVQFSTYDQTPITRPRQTHPRPAGATPQGRWWYEMQTGPDTRATPPTPRDPPRAGSAPSGPNSVPTDRSPTPAPFRTPPR